VVQLSPPPAARGNVAAAGQGVWVFGQTDYLHRAGPSQTASANFSVVNPAAPYVLRVTNGGRQGQYVRISSGTISLNRTPVVVLHGRRGYGKPNPPSG
ncbi:MAG TPA: hypothetical protein VGM03_07555, partial [Phycisphaerae bacterium]